MKLIGISGTNGAGKDSVAEVLVRKYNYLFISVSDLLRNEAKARGLATDRENLRTISAEWRREFGLGVLVDKSVELYQQKGGDSTFSGLVVSSIRNSGEINRIHYLGGKLVWIDADAHVRYKRLFSRGREDDRITFEEFEAQQEAEMQHSGDSATLNMSDVKKGADITIFNEGSTIDQLEKLVEQELGETL